MNLEIRCLSFSSASVIESCVCVFVFLCVCLCVCVCVLDIYIYMTCVNINNIYTQNVCKDIDI